MTSPGRRGCSSWEVGRFPPLRTLDAFPGNLPLQVSSFVGREHEVERTGEAL